MVSFSQPDSTLFRVGRISIFKWQSLEKQEEGGFFAAILLREVNRFELISKRHKVKWRFEHLNKNTEAIRSEQPFHFPISRSLSLSLTAYKAIQTFGFQAKGQKQRGLTYALVLCHLIADLQASKLTCVLRAACRRCMKLSVVRIPRTALFRFVD